MPERMLDHDPTKDVIATTGELPPEPLESFPTRSSFDPMGEVAAYRQLALGATQRPVTRVLVAIGLVVFVLLPLFMGAFQLVAR